MYEVKNRRICPPCTPLPSTPYSRRATPASSAPGQTRKTPIPSVANLPTSAASELCLDPAFHTTDLLAPTSETTNPRLPSFHSGFPLPLWQNLSILPINRWGMKTPGSFSKRGAQAGVPTAGDSHRSQFQQRWPFRKRPQCRPGRLPWRCSSGKTSSPPPGFLPNWCRTRGTLPITAVASKR